MRKDRLWMGVFLAYVVVLAVGTVDQVFLDSMIFPPALDRQILGMVDVLEERPLRGVEEAREAAERVRERLAGIRLEQNPSKLEIDLAAYAKGGNSLEEGRKLLEEARTQAVTNLVENDEFSLKICIRALDPDLILRLWVPGSDDPKVKEGCLEALKKISGKGDGFGYDPKADPVARREAIAKWLAWYDQFMDERRRPAPAAPLPQVAPPPLMGPDGKPLPPVPVPQPPAPAAPKTAP